MVEYKTIKGSNKTPPFFANNNTTGKRCELLQSYEYIPLDYVKFQLINYSNDLMNNEYLKFMPVYKNTIINHYFAEYDNMIFKIYNSGSIYISGSLHKLYNRGKHNSNDFDLNAFKDVLKDFNDKFDILPKNLRILGLEFGVNIEPIINTDTILNNILQHKRIDFENNIKSRYGNYLQAKHSNFILKIYNKAKQYKLDKQLLRIEVKQCNWSEYRKRGLNTFQDFIGFDKKLFIETLINKWNEVIFYNPLNKSNNKWNKYSNVNFWRELKEKSNTTYSKHVNRLRVINNQCEINIQENISTMILNKINSLQGFTNSNFNVKLNESDIIKKCLITGVDISNQRNDSFLLSHTGLINLYKINNIEFERIKNKYLSKNWFNSDLKTQIKEIAHNIRTRFVYRNSKYNENQITLF
jgi:hypothetical protein